MDLDAKVCYCFHITRRKLVNFARRQRPKVPSQLSECGGAGTGCGWCIPFLKQIFYQGDANELETLSPEEYERRRAEYVRAGKGTPPAGAAPLPAPPAEPQGRRLMPLRYRAGCAALGLAALWLVLPTVHGETCMSPFVKRLDRPEKVLYVYCVDADAKDNDFLAVIDVAKGSKTYGQITYQLDLGSKGNEPHHFGYTDDRTHIWGLTLFSNRIFLIDVTSDPARPRIVKTLEGAAIVKQTGLSSPHTAYALPGRMLVSFLSGKDGTLPAGLAEFTNDGTYIRTIPFTDAAPYGYDVAIKPDLNRMVTSGFTYYENFKKPLAQMDLKKFGTEIMIWDFRARKVLATMKTGVAPLECRWSLKAGANLGFVNCALDNSIWYWTGTPDGAYQARKLCDTGKLPADLRQSPDDRFLFVSCFASDEIQQWDVRDLAKPKLVSTLRPGVQPNMMHLSGDGKRMYITNSLLSTMDRADEYWVKLAHVTPEGLKLEPGFHVDLTKLKTGAARGHDMLLN